jgi:hypothetical protein
MLVVFVLIERATPHARVMIRMLTRRPIVIANVAGFVLGIANFTSCLARMHRRLRR